MQVKIRAALGESIKHHRGVAFILKEDLQLVMMKMFQSFQ